MPAAGAECSSSSASTCASRRSGGSIVPKSFCKSCASSESVARSFDPQIAATGASSTTDEIPIASVETEPSGRSSTWETSGSSARSELSGVTGDPGPDTDGRVVFEEACAALGSAIGCWPNRGDVSVDNDGRSRLCSSMLASRARASEHKGTGTEDLSLKAIVMSPTRGSWTFAAKGDDLEGSEALGLMFASRVPRWLGAISDNPLQLAVTIRLLADATDVMGRTGLWPTWLGLALEGHLHP
eukprot:scaffold216813_cov31-Tisochrysis_lutea.AAC.4